MEIVWWLKKLCQKSSFRNKKFFYNFKGLVAVRGRKACFLRAFSLCYMHIFFQSFQHPKVYNFIDASSTFLWRIIENEWITLSLPENVLRKTFYGDHSSSSMGYSKLKITNYFFNLLVSTMLDHSLKKKNFLSKWWPVKLGRPIFAKKISHFLIIKEKVLNGKKSTVKHHTFIYERSLPSLK